MPGKERSRNQQKSVRIKSINKNIVKDFHVCGSCGYNRGFHVSFVKAKKDYEAILFCPQCGNRFKIEWNVKLG
ncbi:MAG: hypothetical protein ABIH76_02920 [Candidatus Bathyarchaeota archaeon]